MMEFVNRLQKEFKSLQKVIEKEGDDLVKKVKAATNSKNVAATRKQVEALVEEKLKKFEPAIKSLITEVKKNAKKAGIDLTDLEHKIWSSPLTQKAAKKVTKNVTKAAAVVNKIKAKGGLKVKTGAKKASKATVAKKTTAAKPRTKKAATSV